MIKVEGYQAFHGTMMIVPPSNRVITITGDWLYKPDTDCWYGDGRSFPASICTVISED